jgi:hypothetical protein
MAQPRKYQRVWREVAANSAGHPIGKGIRKRAENTSRPAPAPCRNPTVHVQFCCMSGRESSHREKASRVGHYHEQPNVVPI